MTARRMLIARIVAYGGILIAVGFLLGLEFANWSLGKIVENYETEEITIPTNAPAPKCIWRV